MSPGSGQLPCSNTRTDDKIVLLPSDQKLVKASLVLHTCELKEDIGKTKTKCCAVWSLVEVR